MDKKNGVIRKIKAIIGYARAQHKEAEIFGISCRQNTKDILKNLTSRNVARERFS